MMNDIGQQAGRMGWKDKGKRKKKKKQQRETPPADGLLFQSPEFVLGEDEEHAAHALRDVCEHVHGPGCIDGSRNLPDQRRQQLRLLEARLVSDINHDHDEVRG